MLDFSRVGAGKMTRFCLNRRQWSKVLAVWAVLLALWLGSCSLQGQDVTRPPVPSQSAAQPSGEPASPVPGTETGGQPSSAPAANTFTVSVHFVAVGQGDCILIQTASGESVLVDGGPRSAGSEVVRYLRGRGVKKLAYVVGTHPHEDHIGGLISVLESVSVDAVIDSAVPHTTRTFETYLLTIKEKSVRYVAGRAGQTYRLGDLTLRVLWPEEPPPEEDLNACSVVLLVAAGDVRVLLTGDLPGRCEDKIKTAAQMLKVAHHGSKSSTSSAFLKAVRPGDAVICVGENPYGHPAAETLKRLADAGVRIYRTDLQGAVVLTTDGKTYSFDKEPWEYRVPPGSGAAAPAASGQGKFVGSRKSDRYHYPWCSAAKKISPANLVEFRSAAEARAAGYVPCGICKPPEK